MADDMLQKAFGTLPRRNIKLIVAGNSSADLDSVVSSICYSYFYNIFNKTDICHPFLDIKSQELRLRKDVGHVLRKFGLTHSQLCFQEDLKLLSDDAKLILVDHNSLQNKAFEKYVVTQIIDHHADEGYFKAAEPRIIEVSGSCASLVFNYWYSLLSTAWSKDEVREIVTPIVDLIMSPILMDTSNMTQKVEEHDIKAIQTLQSFTTTNVGAYFQEIHAEKLNIEGLSVTELLKKDYKVLVTASGLRVGFSSLVKPLGYILKNNSANEQDFEHQILEYVKENDLDILILMTAFTENEIFQREIAFHFQDKNNDLPQNLERPLQLQAKYELGGLQVYHQQDTKQSRKQVLPLVKSLI